MTDFKLLAPVTSHVRLVGNLFQQYSNQNFGLKDYLEENLYGREEMEITSIVCFMFEGVGYIVSNLENSIEVIRLCKGYQGDVCPIMVNSWNVKSDDSNYQMILDNVNTGAMSAYAVIQEYVCKPNAAVRYDELEYLNTLYTIFNSRRTPFKEELFAEFASLLKIYGADYTDLFYAFQNRRKVTR